jgi:uncharacterized protein YggE
MKYLFVIILLNWSAELIAQVSGNSNYTTRTVTNDKIANATVEEQTITLSVKGLLNAKADTYVAFFHIIQVGENIEATNTLMNGRIKKFIDALKLIGVDTNMIQVDMLSFVPRYERNAFNRIFSAAHNEVPDGFEMQKNISIRYTKSSILDAIVTAAASAEIYDLVKVDYFVNDISKLNTQLRSACVESLTSRLSTYEALGFKPDTLKKIFDDDFSTILPQNRYGSYQAIARPSIKATERPAGASDKLGGYHDHSPSVYYQAVSYEDFDVVINPVIDQPVVQLTYDLDVRFILPATNGNDVRNIFFLGANGQLQKIGPFN